MNRFNPIASTMLLAAMLTAGLPASGMAAAVESPDGAITVNLELKEKLEPYPAGTRLYYSITFQGKTVLLDSPFGLAFKDLPPLARNLAIQGEERTTIDESWTPVWGTHKQIANHANELVLHLEESSAPKRKLDFAVRVFNDGVAFRYVLPEQPGIREFKIAAERSEFHFTGDPTVWAADYETFTGHQEAEFRKRKLSTIRPGAVIGCPLLVDTGAAWVALTEANLVDWAGLYFTGHGNAPNAVVSALSPRMDEPDVAVISRAPRHSPWRTIMIGERPGDLIESNIIVNLADPCEIEDTSWIKPGISAWDRWWPGSYAPDFKDGKLDMSTDSMKYFVDFAGKMGWEYQLVDWTWYGPPFDPEKPFGTAGNPKADITRSIPELDLPELIRHAKQKGVKILLWLDWFNADQQMERAFPLYEKWGAAGVKVDFMARDDQEMVNFYHRLVKLAARHHLTVDYHGAYKPTGFRRTYPNLLTREGVLGNEYTKWSDRITPSHTVTLPFTRMLCGPMDFTPGGFRHKTVKTFRAVGNDAPGPFVMNTRCHQLAMFVVYYSPLQVAPDSPYNYRMSSGGLDFLKVVPTTWDDSRVLDGYPGEFIVMARRSGDDWFIGGMNGDEPREVKIPLEFLGGGPYKAHIYSDAEEVADYPERLWERTITVTAGETLRANMTPGGGYVVHLTKER